MDNQHRLIPGYREMSQSEIDAINSIKLAEQDIGQLFQQIRSMDSVDQETLAIAKTKLQEAFSWFVRSMAKPLDVYELYIEPSNLERVEQEHEQLVERIKDLRAYIDTNPHFQTLASNDQRMMREQLDAMDLYAYNLFFRINGMRNNPPEGGWK